MLSRQHTIQTRTVLIVSAGAEGECKVRKNQDGCVSKTGTSVPSEF